jgi:chondroitin 4-sulfotransferase 11
MQAIISHKHKYIYFYTPKVACTTIRNILAKFEGLEWHHPWDTKKTKFDYINSHNASKYAYFKFAFVRNPWDRLVSCYFDKVVGVRSKPDNVAIKNGVFKGFAGYNRDFKNMNFPEFAALVCSLDDLKSNGHFRSQYTFFDHKNINFVGRFENLIDDVVKLQNKLKMPNIKEKHLMKSKHAHYKDYFNDKLIQMVANRYKKDIEMFGYTY